MSDEQKQQGVDLSGEYEVEQPKVAAQPKAKPAAQPVAQTPEEDGGVDLSQDYEVGGKALPGKPAVSTAETKNNPAYNDPTKESHPVGEFLSENPTVASGLEWFNKHVAQPPVHMGEEAGKIGGHMAKTAAMDVDQTMSNPGQVMNQLDPTASQPPQKNPVQEEQELAQYEKEHPVIAGIAHGIGEFTGGLVGNPTNWPFMASNTAPAFLKKAMAYGFGTQMAKGEYDTIKNLTTNWKDMSVEQRAAELTKLVPQTYFTAHAAADTGAPQAIHENVVAPAVRGAADVATKVAPTIPYAVGAIAGHLADHPYIGGLIGKLVIPKESVNNVLETGRLYGLSDEDAAAKWTQERATAATKAAKAAKESLDKFKASSTQGNPPHEYVDAYLKTKLAADEATYHAEEAKAAAAAAKKQTKGTVTEPVPFHGPTPAEAEPEITTKSAVPAEPVLGKLGAPRTPPTVSPAHATTTIPQEPTATPNTPYGQIKLPGGEPVGTQRLLTEGTPEGPQVPKGGLPKINLPEAKPETPKAASKPERGNLRDLKVDETGKVVEKDPEGERLHQLLIESLKNTKGNENFPAAKVEVDKPAVKQAEDNVEATKKPLEVAQQKYDAAVAEHNKYSASHAQGIDSPKPVKASLEKAKAELNEAQAHHDLAKEHLEKTKVEAPTDDRGGERRVAEEALPEGQEERRQNERRVLQGMNERAFTEGHTGQGGENTIDTDAYAKAMEQARKELGPNASVKDVMKRRDEIVKPEAKGKTGDVGTQSREANPEPTRAEAKAKPVLPKEEPTGYTAKKEEVVPAGAEGREPIKSAAEYHPAVEQKINELSDENLKKLAQAHGLNPDEYDFKARDERRHRTERDQLAKDITEQIGEDEKINLGRAAEQAEKEPGFANRDQSAKARADRAEKLFPRLRGPVDEYGNPKMSGGSQGADEEAERLKQHIAETSSKDTDHVQAAMKELGPDAKLSDIMDRAQKMKADASSSTSATAKVANNRTVNPEALRKAIDEFNRAQGKPPINSKHLEPDSRQDDMAEFYKKTPHTPNDPEVKKSYDSLKRDIDKQYDLATKMGFKFDGTKGDTYSDSFKGLKDDVNNNKHIYVWQGADFPEDHPLSAVDPKTGFTYAEKLLAIHDLFGHVAHDKNFTVNGEENAWNMHRQMFSPEAQAALATETRGRGAFGAKYKDFSSKAMLMPEHLQVRPEEVTNKLKGVVNEYNKKEGRPALDEKKIDVDKRQQDIADAYANSKHAPNDPEVKKSYDSLKRDIDKQYALAEKQGYKFDAKENDPYEGEGTGNEHNAYAKLRKDAIENKHISAWKGGAPPADHPLSEVDPKTGLTYNDKLRNIHDLFGHVVPDNDFTGKGEENAWNAHRQMFSKESLPALATETRGQTAYVEKNGKFADQRATVLPKEFHGTAEEHATDTLNHIKAGKDYAILTAENPENTRASSEDNTKYNRELLSELRDKGYEVHPVEGHTKDVEGNKENSFFVKDIKPEDAAAIGRKYKQAAVLTTEGLHNLRDDVVTPSDNSKVLEGDEAKKQPYYSTVAGKPFSVPLDFDKAAEPGKAPLPTASGGSQSSGENKRTMFFDPDKLTPKKEELENAKLRMRESGKTPIEWAKEMKAKNPEPIKVTHQNGTYTIEDGHHRYLAATLLNDALKAEVTDKPSTKNAKGSPVDEFGNPTVSGGAPEKKLPTGDALIKKYGESNGDPKDLTFILKDGRGVANTGIEHDHMLGGRTDEKVPPRERFIAEGNIRVRPRQGAGGREVAMSIPESGVTADQLKYIQKMSPQLKSGAVMIEVGKPGGGYKAIPYGEASPEQLETVIRGLGPVLNDKGSPIDWNGNPTVSGGSPSAGTGAAKDALRFIKDNSNVLPAGNVSIDDLGNASKRHFLLSDGSMISEKVPIHSDIEGMVGGKNLQAAKAIRMAGPAEFDVYSEPTPQQVRELGRILKDYREDHSYGKIYWSIRNATGKEIGNAGTFGDFQRDLETAYPDKNQTTAKVGKLPKLAEKHLTEEEKAGVTKTEAGRQRFVDNLKKLPSVQEFTDIAKAGEGGRKWYQRSATAFDALTEEAPKYFKEGDRQKFTDFLAALSPQQSVKMNLGEALNTWTKYVDEGRPTGKELEKLLKDELTLSGAKIPNATKALAGEPLWPDLSKNSNFKVPSFAKNLNGYLNHVTNDGWQALFGGLDAKEIAKANSYHPLAVVTRAAADALGWSPAEAQAAIWAFTKTFTEKGETLPEDIRRRSEDFADILALDPEIRQQLKQLGVNHEQLDTKLRAIGKKPAITSGASPTTEDSVRKLAARIEKARGAGTIPQPKSGNLNFNDEDEETRFNPADFKDEDSGLTRLGEKKNKSPYGSVR